MTRKSLTGVICQLIFIIENGNTVLSIDRFNYDQLNQPQIQKSTAAVFRVAGGYVIALLKPMTQRTNLSLAFVRLRIILRCCICTITINFLDIPTRMRFVICCLSFVMTDKKCFFTWYHTPLICFVCMQSWGTKNT